MRKENPVTPAPPTNAARPVAPRTIAPRTIAPECYTELVVDAPVVPLWSIVGNPLRTPEWSHECHQVTWLRGATAAVPGARFRGRNRAGRLRWSRVCEIVSVDVERELVWRTVPSLLFPDSTEWRIRLQPLGTQTRIVQTYQSTSMPRWFGWLISRVNPLHIDRSGDLNEDLRRLAAIVGGGGPRGGA